MKRAKSQFKDLAKHRRARGTPLTKAAAAVRPLVSMTFLRIFWTTLVKKKSQRSTKPTEERTYELVWMYSEFKALLRYQIIAAVINRSVALVKHQLNFVSH